MHKKLNINRGDLISEIALKRIMRKKGFRIGRKNLRKLAVKIEDNIAPFIERSIRNAVISGRKTLRGEDF